MLCHTFPLGQIHTTDWAGEGSHQGCVHPHDVHAQHSLGGKVLVACTTWIVLGLLLLPGFSHVSCHVVLQAIYAFECFAAH